MSEGHVLIVDDDPALLQALPEALQMRMTGLTVDTAQSGAVALDQITARDYETIVTDIKIPGMDGLELLAEIRTHRPDTPTLMITGTASTTWWCRHSAPGPTTSSASRSIAITSSGRCAVRSRSVS